MVGLGGVHGGEALNLAPNLTYQAKKSNPVTYDVDFSVVVTPPYHAKVLKVWLPLPPSDAAQEVVEKELTSFPIKVEPRVGQEETYVNQSPYFKFQNPEGPQIVHPR